MNKNGLLCALRSSAQIFSVIRNTRKPTIIVTKLKNLGRIFFVSVTNVYYAIFVFNVLKVQYQKLKYFFKCLDILTLIVVFFFIRLGICFTRKSLLNIFVDLNFDHSEEISRYMKKYKKIFLSMVTIIINAKNSK